MSKEREALIDRLIKIYGFENKIVIAFATLCEEWEDSKWNNEVLSILVKAHEAKPYFED